MNSDLLISDMQDQQMWTQFLYEMTKALSDVSQLNFDEDDEQH